MKQSRVTFFFFFSRHPFSTRNVAKLSIFDQYKSFTLPVFSNYSWWENATKVLGDIFPPSPLDSPPLRTENSMNIWRNYCISN